MGMIHHRLRRLEEASARDGGHGLFWDNMYCRNGVISGDANGNELLTDAQARDFCRARNGRVFLVNFVSPGREPEPGDITDEEKTA
jgi:hypothetical protein